MTHASCFSADVTRLSDSVSIFDSTHLLKIKVFADRQPKICSTYIYKHTIAIVALNPFVFSLQIICRPKLGSEPTGALIYSSQVTEVASGGANEVRLSNYKQRNTWTTNFSF